MYALNCLRDRRWSRTSRLLPRHAVLLGAILLLVAQLVTSPQAQAQTHKDGIIQNANRVQSLVVELQGDDQDVSLPDSFLLDISSQGATIQQVGTPRRGSVFKEVGQLHYSAPPDLTVRNPDSVSYINSDGTVGQVHILRRPEGTIVVDEDFDDGLLDPAMYYYGPPGQFSIYGSGDDPNQFVETPVDYELLVEGHPHQAVAIGWGGTGGGDTSGSRTNFGVDPRNPTHATAIEVAMGLDGSGGVVWKVSLPAESAGQQAVLTVYDESGLLAGSLDLDGVVTRDGIEVTHWPSTGPDLRDGRMVVTAAAGRTFTLGYLDLGQRDVEQVLFGVLTPGLTGVGVVFDELQLETEVPRPVVMPTFSEGFEDSLDMLWPQRNGDIQVSPAASLAGVNGLRIEADGGLFPGHFIQRAIDDVAEDGFEIRFLIDASGLTPSRGGLFTLMEAICDDGVSCLKVDLTWGPGGYKICAHTDERPQTGAACAFLGDLTRRIAVRRRAGLTASEWELAISVNDGPWQRANGNLLGSGRMSRLKVGLWSGANRAFGTVDMDELEVLH